MSTNAAKDQNKERHALIAKSLVQLKQMQAKLDKQEREKNEPIAIIGTACRFPGGANTPESYWEMLYSGTNAVSDIPADRWDLNAYYDADPKATGKMYTRRGGFIDGIDQMDASFFGISPREAACMDPQQRIFMEASWEALERAGVPFDKLPGSNTGVYAGITGQDYGQLQVQHNPDQLDAYYLTGNVSAFVSGRISYMLGLQGPCMSMDTACSSSLVAIHQACAGLRNGDCEMALAGGVNVILLPEWNNVLSRANMMAPDGHCKTFDKDADGYVRGEGCGVVVLKRLSQAQKDGDPIAAVIRGSAINQDGQSSGITVPNGLAQQALIRQTLANAGLESTDVDYVETHGTGTSLGDPIEVRSLAATYGAGRSKEEPLYIGSVKTNIGHLEPAAGVAGLIKAVLSLQHAQIPPHLHFNEVNDAVPLDEIPAIVNTDVVDWPKRNGRSRRCGLSSFGASGTNAHFIIEEAPVTEPVSNELERSHHLLTLSAKSKEALVDLAGRYADILKDEDSLANVAFTANGSRKQFSHKLAVVAANASSAQDKLRAFVKGEEEIVKLYQGQTKVGKAPKVAFLFSGQGSQYAHMSKDLYASQPIFKTALDQCFEFLTPILSRDPKSVLFPETGEPAYIDETCFTQPLLFSVEYALAQLWLSFGVKPTMILGHSVGEYVAACVAGVFSLEDGLKLICERARLMTALPGKGAMMAVYASAQKVTEQLEPFKNKLSVAAYNGPESVVVSGFSDALDEFQTQLKTQGIESKALVVSCGFHSPQMDPMLDEFEQFLTGLTLNKPQIPIVSNLTGELIKGEEMSSPAYWRRHIREPVRFVENMQVLSDNKCSAFIEIGPSPTLTGMAKRFIDKGVWLPSLRNKKDDFDQLFSSLAELYTQGYEPSWQGVDKDYKRSRLVLPTYPFQRKRYWMDYPMSPVKLPVNTNSQVNPASSAVVSPVGLDSGHPLLGVRLPLPSDDATFESLIDLDRHTFLADFIVDGVNVANIGVYVEMALAGLVRASETVSDVVLDDLLIFKALVLEEGLTNRVQLVLSHEPGSVRFKLFSTLASQAPNWTLHTQGRMRLLTDKSSDSFDIETWCAKATQQLTSDAFYRQMWRRKLYLGPAAKWIDDIWLNEGEAVSRMKPLVSKEEIQSYGIHPGLIDCAFQLLYSVLPEGTSSTDIFMLVGWTSFEHRASKGEPVWCRAVRRTSECNSDTLVGDVYLLNEQGEVVVDVKGAILKLADRAVLLQEDSSRSKAVNPFNAALLADGTAKNNQHKSGISAVAIAERPAKLREVLTKEASLVLGFETGDLDWEQPLHEAGLDSLMALELKTKVEAALGMSVPLSKFLEGPSIHDLVDNLNEELTKQAENHQGENNHDDASGDGEFNALPVISADIENQNEPFGLTDLQQAYFVGRSGSFELGNVATFFLLEVEIYNLDMQRLNRALNQVIARHGMLRAIVHPDGQQQILKEVPSYIIKEVDLIGESDSTKDQVLAQIHEEMSSQVLEADKWPLYDIRAIHTKEGVTRLHLGLDALAVDAWSTSIVFREWSELYHDENHSLATVDLCFRDYIQGLESVRKTSMYIKAQEYWDKRLTTLPPAPELPLVKNPASLAKPEFVHHSGTLEPEIWEQLKARAQKARVTPSVVIGTAYAEILAAWSKNRHFTLDLLFFNRLPMHEQVKDVVANFSSTILVEVDMRGPSKFEDRARSLQQQLASDLEHSIVSGVHVLRELSRSQGSGRTVSMPVVFASTINLQAQDADEGSFGLSQHLFNMGDGGRELHSSIRTPQVWLDHQVLEEKGSLVFNWDAVEELFPDGMVDDMFAAYSTLLRRLATDDDVWSEITRHGLIPDHQLAARLEANATKAPVTEELLHTPFLKIAKRCGKRLAVISPEKTLNYEELDRRSEELAKALRAAGTVANTLVVIAMHKGWEQVVAAMAILKAGGAYLPVNPDFPTERIHHLLKHAGAQIVVTQPRLRDKVSWPKDVALFDVNEKDTAPKVVEKNRLQPIQKAHDLSYIIYTSGSTGLPKGVTLEHQAAMNTIVDINNRWNVGPDDRAFAISSLSFDLSVYDVFGMLSVGAAVVIPEDSREPAKWIETINDRKVTIWNSVPALMEMLTEHSEAQEGGLPESLRLVMMSGDWIPIGLPGKIRMRLPKAEIVSLGGATEGAIWSIFYAIDKVEPHWHSVPYGKPLTNQRFHVLDELMEPCPEMVAGELYIAGTGVARGYWNDPERTEKQFFNHPRTQERLYKTGDLGRYLSDGNIEFLGREDSQVKVQGYRIELGEIEAALNHLQGVNLGVVEAIGEDHGSKTLIGYVVLESGVALDQEQLKLALGEKIPSYMIPTLFIFLDQLPLTGNGKIDRKSLPSPSAVSGVQERGFVAPRSETEQNLAALWQELLNVEDISINSDFFELGGQSFLAMRMMARIAKTYKRNLPLATLFTHASIEKLARLLDTQDESSWSPLVPIQAEGLGAPLFMVHPVGGNVLCYQALAQQMKLDRPIYGLQARGLEEGQVPHANLEDMAREYIEAIRAHQPRGPYTIGGWSLGGVVAFEIAQQLSALGEEVSQVVIIDSRVTNGEALASDDMQLLVEFSLDLGRLGGREVSPSIETLASLSEGDQVAHVLDLAKAQGALPAEVSEEQMYRLWQVYKESLRALARYVTGTYKGKILVFRAEQNPLTAAQSQWGDWAKVSGSCLDFTVPGDHYTLVREPLVTDLANILKAELTPTIEAVGALESELLS